MMKPSVFTIIFFLILLGLVFATPVSAAAYTLTLVDEAGNPLANYPADYPTELRNLKLKYRCGGSWGPETSFQTDANGQYSVIIPDVCVWDKKITMTLDQTTKEQDVTVNPVLQAAKVNANLKSCTGPITAVPGGTVAQGGGFWYDHGTTGSSGTVSFYTFPADIKLRMTYNHNTEERNPVTINAGTNEVNFQTTKLTINYAEDVRSNKGGSWWMFSKPSMDLLPGDFPFYFKNGAVWDGPLTISVSGCTQTYPAITCTPELEICDGLDNDCDGVVDNGIAITPTSCGLGTCGAAGLLTCTGGQLVDSCVAGTPGTETCNGLDDDCDGSSDEVCTATISVQADIHSIGEGTRPNSVKSPFANLVVKVFDKSPGSCVSRYGVSWQNYLDIYTHCNPPSAVGTTDANGHVDINVIPGDYIIIGDDGQGIYLGVSAGDVTAGTVTQKYLQQIIKADAKKVPAKSTVKTGSLLLIIEPEYIEWDNTTELYPFVFDSVGDWGVMAAVTPPEGFVSDYPALFEAVNSEVSVVQFTITDVGSDWVPTKMEYTITHKGKTEKVKTKIGVAMSKKMAKLKGLDTKEKRDKKGFDDLVIVE